MTETTTPSVEGDRLEAIARLVDPQAWADREVFLRRNTPGDLRRAATLVEDSLAKARQIAALPCKGGEATDEMVEAGVEYWHNTEALLDDLVRGLYRAMTAATPTTEADTGRGLREALERARILIGASNDYLSEAQRQGNVNAAWHIIDDLLAALSDTPSGREISEVETHRADAEAPASKGGGE